MFTGALADAYRFDSEVVSSVANKKPVRILLSALLLMAVVQAAAAQPAWMTYTSGSVQDHQGNAYFVGFLDSDILPVTAGAFQTKFNGGTCGATEVFGTEQPAACRHGFAVKISADGKSVLYATYLESSGDDLAFPVGVDASGGLFVRVRTSSTDFPQTSSIDGLPPAAGSPRSYFILELSPDGAHLLFSDSFYFPGVPGVSDVDATALIPNGNILFGGTTDGTAFPTTPGAYLSARPNVSLDGFVFEWNPETNKITHSTLIGGSNQDLLTSLTVDGNGNVCRRLHQFNRFSRYAGGVLQSGHRLPIPNRE